MRYNKGAALPVVRNLAAPVIAIYKNWIIRRSVLTYEFRYSKDRIIVIVCMTFLLKEVAGNSREG